MIINDQRGSSHGQTISYMYMTLVEIHQCVCECVIYCMMCSVRYYDNEEAIGILGFFSGIIVYLGMHELNYLGHNIIWEYVIANIYCTVKSSWQKRDVNRNLVVS